MIMAIYRYELFVRITSTRIGQSSGTAKIIVEAENSFKARLQAEALYGRQNIISPPTLKQY